MDKRFKAALLISLLLTTGFATDREALLREESRIALERSLAVARFYSMEEGEELREITDAILSSDLTRDRIKKGIRETGRRFFLFRYLSDGFQVKGILSFVPNPSGRPLFVFLRGGNREFGLMHPASDFSCIRDYTVLATTYRGGVSEGQDEFGGSEVADISNLVNFLPVLEEKLKMEFNPKALFMMGGSRGGLELFLALVRDPVLSQKVTKAVSLSAPLDLRQRIEDRADMKQMFIADFGLRPGENEDEWINWRDPLQAVSHIRKDLPILIIQGTEDLRTPLHLGLSMVEKLKEQDHLVDYVEIQGADHCLDNYPGRMDLITNWLEQDIDH